MTYSATATHSVGVTAYLQTADQPDEGFALVVGPTRAVLSQADAVRLGHYLIEKGHAS